MPAQELLDEDFAHLSYKPEEAISYLLYLDANNLYGSAMSQYLPHSDFNNPTSDVGYILEVDMSYAQELHDLHDELPFCPENIVPPIEGKRQLKLIPNLFNKNNYVLHYRNLHQAVKHGLKIDKIHRILSFNQSNWLQPYIDLNTRKRQAGKNAFEKDLFKLFVNAIFGKCMEAVDKHLNIKLVSRWKNYKRSRGAESLIASPHFHSLSIFNENFVAIQLRKPRVHQKNINKFDTSNYKPDNPYGIPLVFKAVLGCFKDEANGRPMLEFLGLRSKLYDYVLADNTVVKKAKGVKKCPVTAIGLVKDTFMLANADHITNMVFVLG
ncbi:hypothetical protein NQ315_003475 [Exocentrus adspersus]|uniref:DNA-directed DNA polymerase n=1 Tax=Exocentrus adspersus TaxID=1586481 RepID=A0AAV8V5G1_9CUCU|nr:hypothetical protein NQ315_003475 [Exocentrus adspersus]